MTDTNPPADRIAEADAAIRAIAATKYHPAPWASEYDFDGVEINFDPCHKVYDDRGHLVAVTESDEVHVLLMNAVSDIERLSARVEVLEGQLAKARSTTAIDALTTARRAVSDYRIGLGRNRTHVDARFQGRLRGLEEAAGQLTALIKSLRANEPGIEAGDEH
jgi:hypothetical protein